MEYIGLSLLIGAIILWFKWMKKDLNHFERQGIPHDKPWPVVGNLWPLVTKREGVVQFVERINQNFENAK
jgi:hypothetical protein